ncbi:MAG: lysine 2,3-aminomutase [Bacteroidales bacterium]|nr:lysine 2,3-aminomutase [Bacteroidales bacterium]
MKHQSYSIHNYQNIDQFSKFSKEQREAIEVVSKVFPFKTNNYVTDKLIDWDNFEDDPMFILNFPQKDMLQDNHYNQMLDLIRRGADKKEVYSLANDIRRQLNPHPAGQESNVPFLNGEKLLGIQHKYKETVLFFPTQGQTCHAYCTFCFRWPQFTNMDELKFAMKQSNLLTEYLENNQSVSDLLITGGDPMVMNINNLKAYIEPILNSHSHNLNTIRIGTKSLSFWPDRFINDKDSEDVLRLFEKVSKSGLQLALMAHINHPRELSTKAVQEAIRRIRNTGVQIRTQSPLLNHINNKPELWSRMWRHQVALGLIPYYMFIARDTGAQHYFGTSLKKSIQIFSRAYSQVSGLARTVRGPSMSADPGKVQIAGVTKIRNQKVFVLNFLQGRNPDWVNKPFFAEYDENAKWLDELVPFEDDRFFFEDEFDEIKEKQDKKIVRIDNYKTTA